MKYAGTITIYDDNGEIVFERDLTPDQIIETLLTKSEAPAEEALRPEPDAPEPEKKHSDADLFPTRKNRAKGKSGKAAGGGKACCGSKGTRHMKDCASAGDRTGVQETFNESNGEREERQPKACCGSKGSRHMKGCKLEGTELHGKSKNRRTVDNRHPFSEPTYTAVKTLLERESSDFVSSEKGLDLEEVRRADLSNDYQDYLTIA